MMNPEPSSGIQQASHAKDDTPWWMKYGVRILGTASSLAALILGAMACITLTPTCLTAGIFLMLSGVLVALIEAPCLCMFLDFAQVPSQFFDAKPAWFRGILYIVISILPLSLCFGFRTFFGSGLIFATGIFYGVIGLGKKAPADQMRMKASSSYNILKNNKGDIESSAGFQNITSPSGPI